MRVPPTRVIGAIGLALWTSWLASWLAPVSIAAAQDGASRPPLDGTNAADAIDGANPDGGGQCIDATIRDELNARRRYRGVQERLFRKALRHEISLNGGIYSADLLSSSWTAGGSYTFHFTEALGLELGFGYTRADSELLRIVERTQGLTLVRVNRPVFVYTGHLLWSLAYGKVRWFGGGISRFDFYLALGGGVTDNQTARGLTFSGGIGMKFYFGNAFALRIDVRDQVLSQELLGESAIVNNITATLGISVFLPFRN